MEKRSIWPHILIDLEEKIVILGGPRQSGKTFMSRNFFKGNATYLNYDEEELRKIIQQKEWPRDSELVIFDELHKMRRWKAWLKGIYDTEGVRPQILVTGSARLDTYKKTGDSLAGRHFYYRLYPFSLAELKPSHADKMLVDFLKLGSFPEPFLKGSETWAKRWRKSHLERILREDLLDLEKVQNIKLIEILVELLSERVGSPISYASLARDLEVSPHTVKKWIRILEDLFVIFVVTPYNKSIAKSILKAPKIYFFDTGRVKNEAAMRLENFVALSLLKHLHFLEDTQGETCRLHYIADKLKREVDFACVINKEVESLIEVKLSDTNLAKSLQHYTSVLKPKHSIQLVQNIKQERQRGPIQILSAAKWLSALKS